MAGRISLSPSDPTSSRAPGRRPRRHAWVFSGRTRLGALGLGVSSPVVAESHVLYGLSLPLMVAIIGSVAVVGTAAWTKTLARLYRRAAARRRNNALLCRLRSLCCLGDFPNRQQRVSSLVGFLARRAGLSWREQKLFAAASRLHRVGLVCLPPSPAGETGDSMRRAADIACRLLSGPTRLHREAAGMALLHQESWDGAGLPSGLAGTAIPLPTRLLHVALALDALLPRAGAVPDRATLATIARRIAAEGGRTLDPWLSSLVCEHLDELQTLLGAGLFEPCQADCHPARDARWSKLGQAFVYGVMLTPA